MRLVSFKHKNNKNTKSGYIKKIKNEDTNISLDAINKLCLILDMTPKDILDYEETEKDREEKIS